MEEFVDFDEKEAILIEKEINTGNENSVHELVIS